jgi:hypothetical protein
VTVRSNVGGRRGAFGRTLLAAALASLALAACRPAAETGTLELRYILPAAATGGLSEVHLEPDWAAANQGEDRYGNYSRIRLLADSLTLPVAGDAPVTFARGDLPVGHYDYVYSETPKVTGQRPDGTPVEVTSHIEPIARGFDLAAGETKVIDVELIVLPRGERFGGGIEIFVKDARVVPE